MFVIARIMKIVLWFYKSEKEREEKLLISEYLP